MEQDIHQITYEDFPLPLKEIADPPKTLYVRGHADVLFDPSVKKLAIVGSRKCSAYGADVVQYLVSGLKGHPICIISGLALGIDALAHEAALEYGLCTVSVPGSGIAHSVLYPKTNVNLAERILAEGGCLLNEFSPTQTATKWTFPKRNRLIAGLADAVLIIEAAEQSGTLITARLASEYNRDLFVVPASIFAKSSRGAHQFLKLGAIPVTTPEDILDHFDLMKTSQHPQRTLSPPEREIVTILATPTPREEVIEALSMSISEAETLLSKLELDGIIKERLGKLYVQ
tara:strand:- start:209 stop:1069 length:861 start_codon:yes stop_codon:yes gene_type:complete